MLVFVKLGFRIVNRMLVSGTAMKVMALNSLPVISFSMSLVASSVSETEMLS